MIPMAQLYTPPGYIVAGIALLVLAWYVMYSGLSSKAFNAKRIITAHAGLIFTVFAYIFFIYAYYHW